MDYSLKIELKIVQPGLALVFKQVGKPKHCISASILCALVPSYTLSLCLLSETQELKAQSAGPEILRIELSQFKYHGKQFALPFPLK